MDGAPAATCQKGWSYADYVTRLSAGAACADDRFSSPLACPAECSWNSSRLQQSVCAGIKPLSPTGERVTQSKQECLQLSLRTARLAAFFFSGALPLNPIAHLRPSAIASRSVTMALLPAKAAGHQHSMSIILAGNGSCLVHLPCSHGGTGAASDADGPCFCCDLAVDAQQARHRPQLPCDCSTFAYTYPSAGHMFVSVAAEDSHQHPCTGDTCLLTRLPTRSLALRFHEAGLCLGMHPQIACHCAGERALAPAGRRRLAPRHLQPAAAGVLSSHVLGHSLVRSQ